MDIDLGLPRLEWTDLIGLALFLLLVLTALRWVLAGVNSVMGRWGWIAILALTLFGVVTVEQWWDLLSQGVLHAHAAIMELAAEAL